MSEIIGGCESVIRDALAKGDARTALEALDGMAYELRNTGAELASYRRRLQKAQEGIANLRHQIEEQAIRSTRICDERDRWRGLADLKDTKGEANRTENNRLRGELAALKAAHDKYIGDIRDELGMTTPGDSFREHLRKLKQERDDALLEIKYLQNKPAML